MSRLLLGFDVFGFSFSAVADFFFLFAFKTTNLSINNFDMNRYFAIFMGEIRRSLNFNEFRWKTLAFFFVLKFQLFINIKRLKITFYFFFVVAIFQHLELYSNTPQKNIINFSFCRAEYKNFRLWYTTVDHQLISFKYQQTSLFAFSRHSHI